MEVALYVRVSTTRPQQTQTIEQQLIRLREHLATRPDWHLAEEYIYRDDGYSGAKLNPPGLDRLWDRAPLATFELVLMTAPDRLARTMSITCPSSTNWPSGAARWSFWNDP
jgi:site-specific DNA recombinase